MKLDKGAAVLSFDVIGLVALDDNDSIENEEKRRDLKRLFRPDRFNEITLLAFVQTCDTVYRRLRYFRASVGNTSVIDNVLEQIIGSIFNFILMLVVLVLLEFNPWPLLVSISTLLVSFAFAVGPSTSRYIEVSIVALLVHSFIRTADAHCVVLVGIAGDPLDCGTASL